MRNCIETKRARPNGFRVVLWKDNEADVWYVETDDNEEYGSDPVEYETLAEAEEAFAGECRRLKDTPNWEAQARYDEEHGTDNGYGRHQYGREE